MVVQGLLVIVLLVSQTNESLNILDVRQFSVPVIKLDDIVKENKATVSVV
jgi:hypothetical protein